eukprot:TRINITY_DN8184_c0_g2_i1.p2 TRINITY_DN8184_c0_g2~~TRINITY_DN8184_c0_g2_i1.p2  ORF type:complete len:132 (+),score=23.61 TRINITY_DN8184_c0_g2_i1:194-589(+)
MSQTTQSGDRAVFLSGSPKMTDFLWLKAVITMLLVASTVFGPTTAELTTGPSAVRHAAPNARGCCSDTFTISSAAGTLFEVSAADRTTRTHGPLSVGGSLTVDGAAHFEGAMLLVCLRVYGHVCACVCECV